ncbi:hypothetical protein JS562_08700, partial [Agrobacterium sp. S2]|nr:hypothetical protein [Agrobacterium sp. S2]
MLHQPPASRTSQPDEHLPKSNWFRTGGTTALRSACAPFFIYGTTAGEKADLISVLVYSAEGR